MGILATLRRCQPHVLRLPAWQPGGGPAEAAPAYVVNDYASTGENAYGATFALPDAPGATIIVWAYAAHTAARDPYPYEVMYCCEYLLTGDDRSQLRYAPAHIACDDLAECDAAARKSAGDLAGGCYWLPGMAARTGFFGWDGGPFESEN